MEQARRDGYLAALGIVRYRSRSAAGVPAAPVGEPEAPVSADQPSAVLGERVPPRSVPPPASAAPAPAASDIDDALPPLRLACLRPAEDLLVLDAQPPGSRPSSEQLALLGNILAAIGRRPAALPAAEYIDWPLLPGGDQSLAGAREALRLFLSGRLAQSRFEWLLAMGEPAWRLLADDAGAGQVLAVAGGTVRAILVPGLADMLARPESKAATWQAIRFLAPERS